MLVLQSDITCDTACLSAHLSLSSARSQHVPSSRTPHRPPYAIPPHRPDAARARILARRARACAQGQLVAGRQVLVDEPAVEDLHDRGDAALAGAERLALL